MVTSKKGLLSGNPAFDKDDFPAIAEFLARHQSCARVESMETQPAVPAASLALNVKKLANFKKEEWQACCKHCENTQNLEGKWGKFGYYVVCPLCQKNTPLKRACPKCQADTKLSKSKSVFSLSCLACGDVGRILVG